MLGVSEEGWELVAGGVYGGPLERLWKGQLERLYERRAEEDIVVWSSRRWHEPPLSGMLGYGVGIDGGDK